MHMPGYSEPEVTRVVLDRWTEEEVLALASAVERDSEHPLARAIVRRGEDESVQPLAATGFENVPGHGAVATVHGLE